jgi:hypothetical protein
MATIPRIARTTGLKAEIYEVIGISCSKEDGGVLR